MRRVAFLLAFVPACTAAVPPEEIERGGQITVSRSKAGASETLTAVASFFAPPGPPVEEWPAPGTCTRATPTPVASPEPVLWRDAGDSIALRGATTLTLPRFDAGGQISYLASPADPDALEMGDTFDLELAGSTLPNGLTARTIAGALSLPEPLSIAAPDFTQGTIAISGSSLAIAWETEGAQAEVLVFMLISATGGGVVTLRCATEDDGSYEIDASELALLPTGGGLLGIFRSTHTVTPLDGTIDLVGVGTVIESGPILIP